MGNTVNAKEYIQEVVERVIARNANEPELVMIGLITLTLNTLS